MELDLYVFNKNLRIKGFELAKKTDTKQDNIYYVGEFDDSTVYFSYSTAKKTLIIYEDENYKHIRSYIAIKDVDLFDYLFDCLDYFDYEDVEVEVVETPLEIENKRLSQLENKE